MERPKLLNVTQERRKTAIDQLILDSSPDADFFLLLILSILIVVPGLLINNAAVIIGGMVVAPLLSPILSLALGVVLSDFKLIGRSLRTLAISLGVIALFAAIIALFYTEHPAGSEIQSRSSASVTYLIIAIASGVAAAYALIDEQLTARLPGIAVSVALLPPVAVAGIGIAYGNINLITGSLAQFGLNLIGIVFSSMILFSLMGFYPVRKEVEKKLKETAKQEVA